MKRLSLAISLLGVCVPWCGATEISGEAQRLIGLETVDLGARSLPPEVPVFGSVMPPAPLIDLFRQIGTAREAVGISKESLERAEKLFAAGELVARKEVQAAEVLQAQDQAVLRGLEDRLALEWGVRFSGMTGVDRSGLTDGLLAGKKALLRLSVPRGERLASRPVGARLHPFGDERSQVRCSEVFPAPSTDPAYQASAFFSILETPEQPLAAGMALNGVLELAGEVRAGIYVPQDVVVFYLGKAWVYRKTGENEFEKEEVPVNVPLDGGWFVAGGALDPHGIVTKGAQSILSNETAGPAEEE